jgi:hypothetical protein
VAAPGQRCHRIALDPPLPHGAPPQSCLTSTGVEPDIDRVACPPRWICHHMPSSPYNTEREREHRRAVGSRWGGVRPRWIRHRDVSTAPDPPPCALLGRFTTTHPPHRIRTTYVTSSPDPHHVPSSSDPIYRERKREREIERERERASRRSPST